LRVDVVELGGADQRVECCGALAATIGAGEQPSLAAERDAAQRAFGSVVGQADTTVVAEGGERRSALEDRVHGLSGLGVTGQPATLGAHPIYKMVDRRSDEVLREAHRSSAAIPLELEFDLKDRIDAGR